MNQTEKCLRELSYRELLYVAEYGVRIMAPTMSGFCAVMEEINRREQLKRRSAKRRVKARGHKIIEGLTEAIAVARGEAEAARVHTLRRRKDNVIPLRRRRKPEDPKPL